MKRTNTNPRNYSLTELLDDPQFLAWVMDPTKELDLYWIGQQANDPNLATLIAEARKLLLSLKFKEHTLDTFAYTQLWQEIAQQTVAKPTKRPALGIWIRTLAAAIVTIVLFGTTLYFYHNRQIEVSTGYGQIQRVLLPDSSTIILNANSSLKYPNNWGADKREVWLTGEAFFKVKHLHRQGQIAKGDFFIVHAGKVAIKVLGTSFNVNQRRDKVGVALISGKISLGLAGSKAQVMMKPGELMVYDAKKNSLFREPGTAYAKMAWKDGLLIFEQLDAATLFEQLEDNYGYKAIFKDNAIKRKKISGTFKAENLDHLLKGIEIALGISIQKDENLHQLIIQ